MEHLTIIKTKKQYYSYCDELETLTDIKKPSTLIHDRIELLLLLIEKWDRENRTIQQKNPVELLKSLMKQNNLKSSDLSRQLDIDKTVLSKILHYQKGFSKELIRKLADFFKVNQEAFNQPYPLIDPINKHHKNEK
jgi:HTH-type transcriptional regulator/antitoxin HigA